MFLFFFFSTATSLLLFDFRRVNLSLQPRWMATHRQQTPWANSLHLQALGWVSLSFPWILSFLQGNNILESPPFACFSSPICHVTQGGKRLFVSSLINNKTFPGGSDSKESACSAGEPGLIPGSGRSPGGGNGNPLQYSYLENPMDRGACQAKAHGVSESGTVQFSSAAQSCLTFATPWTAARQASLSITNFQSLFKLMSIGSVMPSNHLILCRPLLLLPSIFPSIKSWAQLSAKHFQVLFSPFLPSIHPSTHLHIHPSTHPSSQQIFIEHFLSIPPGVFLGAEDTVVNKPRVSLVAQRLQQ